MRILIVKLSALGDIIHALPVLDYLRQAVPEVEIDWIVEEQNRSILEGHPLIRNVICINTRAWRKSPFSYTSRHEVTAVIKQLREAKYDAVFDIQGNIKSGIITALTSAYKRYGFDLHGVRESLNLLFTNHHIPLTSEDHHISNRSLKIISAAFDKNYHLYTNIAHIETNSEDDARAKELLANTQEATRLLFHTGTTWETKKWAAENWLELAQLILLNFQSVQFFFSWGNEQERIEATNLVKKIGGSASLLPRMDLKTFCAVIKSMDVVVGGDTGPVHIAAAVGTPTVSFYRATDASRNGPRGLHHITIQSDISCAKCLERSCKRDDECRQNIKTTAMFNAISGLIAPELKAS